MTIKKLHISQFFNLRRVVMLLLALGTIAVSAQKTVVSGKIYDAETKESLPFVNIAFKGSKIGTTTDIDGAYHLETYYAEDSLVASFIGYLPMAKKVRKDHVQQIDFFLEPGAVSISEVVITAKDSENPAHTLLKHIVKNKPINNRAKLDSYEYEVYNKIQFDLNNLSEKFTQRKLFKDFDFIFDRLDSTQEKVSLPFFMTESISNYYYQRQPRGRKEIIRATKVSGIENESITQFLGQMYLDVNVYDNTLSIFGKNFVSPISGYGLMYYQYYLVDSMYIDGKWCYRLDFNPKNENELVFKGHMWVNDTTYAVKEIDARILKSANINFISDLRVKHRYQEVENEVWMLTREEILADFSLIESETGFYGKKLTTYRDFVINDPKESAFYGGVEHVITESFVNEKTDDYWRENRHEVIRGNEQAIYDMVDSLKLNPVFMTYVDIVNFLFMGYKVTGPVEIGPVFTFLSFNNVEGLRPKFGLRTSNDFSKSLLLEGYVAYGTRDKRFKYSLGGQYFVTKKPRQILGAYYSEDVDLIGQIPNYFPRDHFIQFFTSRNPQDRLILNKQALLFTEREWFAGFSTRLEFKRRDLAARGAWKFERLQQLNGEKQRVGIHSLITSEVSLGIRFAYRENFVEGEFERVSLGTNWPIFNVRMDFGIPGIMGSKFHYQKITATMTDKVSIGPLGNLKYRLEGGRTWQVLPYPLQFVHAGNESIFENTKTFNTMNYFEFVSDKFISVKAEHHFDGLFFNKVPLFQRLKWRELVGVNAIYGVFNDANIEQMVLSDVTYSFGRKPFVEAYVGIENILKFIRVDAYWRLSHLDHARTQNFAVLIGFDLQF